MNNGTKALMGLLTIAALALVFILVLPLLKFVLELVMIGVIIVLAVGGALYCITSIYSFVKNSGPHNAPKNTLKDQSK